MRRILHLIGLLSVIFGGACGCDKKANQSPVRPEVSINGHVWRVEIALTDQQRYQGMSGRGQLDDSSGMLFVYPSPQVLSFCMRDCDWPLDIAFLDGERRVLKVATMAVDRSGSIVYSSAGAAQYALEVRAGTLKGFGVQPGQVAAFSPGIPSPAKADEGP